MQFFIRRHCNLSICELSQRMRLSCLASNRRWPIHTCVLVQLWCTNMSTKWTYNWTSHTGRQQMDNIVVNVKMTSRQVCAISHHNRYLPPPVIVRTHKKMIWPVIYVTDFCKTQSASPQFIPCNLRLSRWCKNELQMLLFPNALCCSLYERNCVCVVTNIF